MNNSLPQDSLPSPAPISDADGQPITFAPPLFDGPDGDVILRTSDNVDFQVYKTILRLASPLFSDMFSLPQPPVEGPDESTTIRVPVISVTEESTTLDALLRICYPVENPGLAKLEISQIGNVLRAAMKYDIDAAISLSRRAFKERAGRGEKDALSAYAIACNMKLEGEARAAAMECLKWPALNVIVSELDLMTGRDYYHLLNFHSRAGNAVAGLLRQFTSIHPAVSTLLRPHYNCASDKMKFYVIDSDGNQSSPTCWWYEATCAWEKAFKVAPLDTAKISKAHPNVVSKLRQKPCFECMAKVSEGWDKTKTIIVAAIEQTVEEV